MQNGTTAMTVSAGSFASRARSVADGLIACMDATPWYYFVLLMVSGIIYGGTTVSVMLIEPGTFVNVLACFGYAFATLLTLISVYAVCGCGLGNFAYAVLTAPSFVLFCCLLARIADIYASMN